MPESKMQEALTSTMHALQVQMSGQYGERGVEGRADERTLESLLAEWPDTPQQVARTMIQQYGAPSEVTATRLIWYGNGPWKRTIVYRDEVPHNFPRPHTDLLEQFVDYRVPLGAFNALAAFDGSVIAERTKGELSARCDKEAMNFLALNLAHEVVSGKRSVEDARTVYAQTATAFTSGESSEYVEGLLFERQEGTTDFDEPAPGAMVEELMRQAKEALERAV